MILSELEMLFITLGFVGIFFALVFITAKLEQMNKKNLEIQIDSIVELRKRLLTELHDDTEKLKKIEEELWYLTKISG